MVVTEEMEARSSATRLTQYREPVGISLSVVQANIFFAAVIIGLITALLCSVASGVGRRFGTMLNDKAEILGGIILVGIGVRILISHLMS